MMPADIAHALGEARREGLGWRCRCPLLNGQSRTRKRSGRGLSRGPAASSAPVPFPAVKEEPITWRLKASL